MLEIMMYLILHPSPADVSAPRPARPTSAPTALPEGRPRERLGHSAPLPSVPAPQPTPSRQPPKPAPRAMSPQGSKMNGASVSMSMSSMTGNSITA